jgi:SAM-dependent methyltransferase
LIKKVKTSLAIIRSGGLSNYFDYFRFRFVQAAIDVLLPLARLKPADDPARREQRAFFDRVNRLQSPAILEIGSRNISHKNHFTSFSEYVGFDVNEGSNVDVVGDAHALSGHFPPGHFDVTYAISVFEHLAMPWKVVPEINKVLKPGGLLFLFTHPNYPPHAEPWDFWRFSKNAFPILLNEKTGFEIVSCVEGWPAFMVSLEGSPEVRRSHHHLCHLGISVLARKISEPDPAWAWDGVTENLLHTRYPRTYLSRQASPYLAYLDARKHPRPADA